MNPVSGAPSLPAAAGPVAATDSSFQSFPWPGLAVVAADIGVPLDATARERFGRYRDLLLEWNTRYNLTAIREPIAVEQKLFLDSLAMVPARPSAVES